MTPPPGAALSGTGLAVCIFSILLIPSAIAGLSLINTGLGRSRSAAHSMMASLCVTGVAVFAYFVCGFAWQGYAGRAAHFFTLGGKEWSWLGSGPFFLSGLRLDGSPGALAVLFGMFSVGLAAIIPLGSGADRWRLGASCASTAILAGWTYPLFAHWVWGGGWLAQLGSNYGLGSGFIDAGGAGAIQTVGGLTALSITWILKPRRGKYTPDGATAAIPGHNAIYVLFGCLVAWLGWLGLNSSGAILFTGAEPGRLVLVAVNTTLAATAGLLTAAVITRVRFGKPDASLSANGWVGGLVAGSAACPFMQPAAAVMTGLIAGALVTVAVEWLEVKFAVDDPAGAVSVHAVCGIWGLLAAGLFIHFSIPQLTGAALSGPMPEHLRGAPGQGLAQLVGVATLLGFVFPMTYGLNWLLDRIFPQRVAAEGERQGMDLCELGGGAYPEFLTHDEYTQW